MMDVIFGLRTTYCLSIGVFFMSFTWVLSFDIRLSCKYFGKRDKRLCVFIFNDCIKFICLVLARFDCVFIN